MKPLAEQDHYEVLEVPRGTSREEIDRAYQLALSTFEENSLAGYSIFEEGDVASIRERIEVAYRVLSDAETRRVYDREIAAPGPPAPAAPPPEPPREPPEPRVIERVEALEAEEEGDEFNGARLRRARLRMGYDIDDVARVTKVNPSYLRFLEEERFAALPARVYVRGFVMSYAACIGLDPQAVAQSYMPRFDAFQPRQPGLRGG